MLTRNKRWYRWVDESDCKGKRVKGPRSKAMEDLKRKEAAKYHEGERVLESGDGMFWRYERAGSKKLEQKSFITFIPTS